MLAHRLPRIVGTNYHIAQEIPLSLSGGGQSWLGLSQHTAQAFRLLFRLCAGRRCHSAFWFRSNGAGRFGCGQCSRCNECRCNSYAPTHVPQPSNLLCREPVREWMLHRVSGRCPAKCRHQTIPRLQSRLQDCRRGSTYTLPAPMT